MSDIARNAPTGGLQKRLETNSILLLLAILLLVSIGGIIEIVPLFYLHNTIEKVEGVRPYSPLELSGYNIYVREGCYTCHSQMIRPLRDEVERYGHYSLAAESMYDHPFQWGSKRNGPDLARVGGRYSNDWQRDHLRDPRSVVPASIMPGYPFLAQAPLDSEHIVEQMKTLRLVGVPYTDAQIDNAKADLSAQSAPDDPGAEALRRRYPNVVVNDQTGKNGVTEEDALIAYLQHLGVSVNFKLYDDKAAVNVR
ncbi:cytochrome c oxidase, cbb3-type subunit II [Methylosinus sp. C49]|uniref:cytochrome-c oxidase, cbb3-type subunit II n=1 Tax=unclassified Methylosinus TaxID=2624500 RepID=UPI00037B5148|nr:MULTISPECIES: cytochrome-c oxidase, cbb3-type subunit II [unclassified Methylosinus]BBU60126.1 cytochrome c oxidase, cbb3-type subunit II [Methylosinus sp. C49]